MSQPDDKSLRNILKRVIGNLAPRVQMEEPAPVAPPPRVPTPRPHEHKFMEFLLQEDFGWPTVQPRNDIHHNISGAEETLREEAIYRSHEPSCDMMTRLTVMRQGLVIDLHRYDGTEITGETIQVEFKKFRRGNDKAKIAEANRVLDELEDNGFFFRNRENALGALGYVLTTWLEEVREPQIQCRQGPEPQSFG